MVRVCMAVVLVAVSGAFAVEPDAATVKYLRSLQQKDGGYATSADEKTSNLRATTLAVRTIVMLNSKPSQVEQTAAFVEKCFDREKGAFRSKPGEPIDVIHTSIGIMAVIALEMPKEKYVPKGIDYLTTNAKTFEERRLAIGAFEATQNFPEVSQKWLDETMKGFNPDGSFGPEKGNGSARRAGAASAMLLRGSRTFPEPLRSKVLETLRAGQSSDGGIVSENGTTSWDATYRTMRAFHLFNEQPPTTSKMRDFIAKRRNPDGGYAAEPGKQSDVSSTYYATIITTWLPALKK